MSNSADDVVVIGAGLAGLNAALTLEAGGARVQVIEAQARVGGRIHSMRQFGDQTEAGGTYIGAGYRRLLATAERFGAEIVDVTPLLAFFREQALVLDGRIIRQADWPTDPANPFPDADKELLPWNYHRVLTMRENPLERPEDWLDERHRQHDVSVAQWLGQLGLSEHAVRIAYGINPSFGLDAHDVSVLLLFFRAAFSKAQREHAPAGQVGFTARGGVQSIPEAMAGALAGEIHFGKIAAAVEAGAGDVEVRCADGSRYRAARVVCAMPFGALRRVAFDPPLPALQQAAIAELDSQPLTQVFLEPRRPFWDDDGFAPSLFTDSAAGMVAATRSGTDPSAITGLTAWTMGRHALRLDSMPAADAGRHVVEALERLRPAARGQLAVRGLHSWGNDLFAGGAWTYFKPGQIGRFAGLLPVTHGRIEFCGEHLAVASRGMEAAMESSAAAAERILGQATPP